MTPGRPEYASAGLAALLVPQANATVEAEMGVLMPPGCGAIAARLTSGLQDARARLLQYAERVDAALDTLDVARPDLALFACTGSTYLVGADAERRLFAEIERRRGYPVLSAARALGDALDALDATRIAIVSPYPGWLTEACAAFWRGQGREVVAVAEVQGERPDTRAIYALGSRDALAALAGADLSRAQAVVLSGTGMPTLGAIASAAVPVPVLSSNVCLAWAAARILEQGPADLRGWLGEAAWWRGALAARFPEAAIRLS